MFHAILAILATVVGPAVGAVVSAYVGRTVAQKVTKNELKKSEERALKAEALYAIAVTYLHQVADWATRNGIADKLPEPPPELGIDI